MPPGLVIKNAAPAFVEYPAFWEPDLKLLGGQTIAALAITRKLALEKYTGSITTHFQEGIAQEIEQHTRKRLKKGT